jgi:hypothetical protein
MEQFTKKEKHFILVVAGNNATMCNDIVPHLAHPSEWGLKWEDATRSENLGFPIPRKISFSGNLFGENTSGCIQLEGPAPVDLMKRKFNSNKAAALAPGAKPKDLLDWSEIKIRTVSLLNPAGKKSDGGDEGEHEKFVYETRGGIRALIEAICTKLSMEKKFMKAQPTNLKEAVEGILSRVEETKGLSIPASIKASCRCWPLTSLCHVLLNVCVAYFTNIGVDSTMRSV